MSIIFFEGFDLYGNWGNTEQDPFVRRDLWYRADSINGADFQERNDGNAMRLNTNVTSNLTDYQFIRLMSQETLSLSHFVCGLAFMKESAGGGADGFPPYLIRFDQGTGTSYVLLRLSPNPLDFDLLVDVFDSSGAGLIVSEAVPSLEPAIWHYMEVDVNLVDPGHCKVWVNGLQVVNATGLTISSGFSNINRFQLGSEKENYHPGGHWYDDMYLLDATDASQGAQFQSRLSPIEIRPCPLNADSSPSNWVASSEGAKYLDVDEQPWANDLDATYISTVTAPQTQMFNCSPYDADLPIIAVTSFAAVKQPDPTNGVAQLAFMVDEQEDSSPLLLQNSYRLFSQNYVTLPGGTISVPVIQATRWGVRSIEGT